MFSGLLELDEFGEPLLPQAARQMTATAVISAVAPCRILPPLLNRDRTAKTPLCLPGGSTGTDSCPDNDHFEPDPEAWTVPVRPVKGS